MLRLGVRVPPLAPIYIERRLVKVSHKRVTVRQLRKELKALSNPWNLPENPQRIMLRRKKAASEWKARGHRQLKNR